MESAHAHRKDEHLALAEAEFRKHPPVSSLQGVRLIPRTLPETVIDQVNLSISDANLPFTSPFYIEAMTGGSIKTGHINQQLATAAKETGLAMAVGSQSVALKDPSAIPTFQIVRETFPDGFLIANLGASHDYQDAQKAIDMIDANALEIHLNVTQEIVMPEGDTTFKWRDNLADILTNASVPVIIKEVGFGMSAETIQELTQLGATYINLGGRSGTNFAKIEDRRNHDSNHSFDYLYDWGLSTAESLLEAQLVTEKATILATGGIQNPLDILKAQVLGAKAVGIAGHFLHTLLNSNTQGLIQEIQQWQVQLTKLYAMVGIENSNHAVNVPYVLDPDLFTYLQQRQSKF